MKCHLLLFLGVFCVLVSGGWSVKKNCQPAFVFKLMSSLLYNCYEEVRYNLVKNSEDSYQKGPSRAYINKACSEFESAMKACNDDFKKQISGGCKITEKQKERISNYSIPFTAGLKFLCQDEDNIWILGNKEAGLACYGQFVSVINICFKDYPLVDLKNEYSEAFCTKAKQGKTCFRESLNKAGFCDSSTKGKDIYRKYFGEIAAATPCSEAN